MEQKGRQRDGGREDFLRKRTGKDEETGKDGERKNKTDSLRGQCVHTHMSQVWGHVCE